MHLAFLALAHLAATKTKSSTTSASSGDEGLILIVIIAVGAYFLFIRPRSMAQRRQRETMQELGPGDEVLTGAGIFGTVLDVASDRITLETAPGTRITVLRSTIARRITPDTDMPADPWPEDGEGSHAAEADADEHDHEPGALGWGSADDAEGHNGTQAGGRTSEWNGEGHEEEGEASQK